MLGLGADLQVPRRLRLVSHEVVLAETGQGLMRERVMRGLAEAQPDGTPARWFDLS